MQTVIFESVHHMNSHLPNVLLVNAIFCCIKAHTDFDLVQSDPTLHNPLRPRPPHVIIGSQRRIKLLRHSDRSEQGAQDHRVSDCLRGAGALPECHGVRGVSCDADAGFDVGGGIIVLPLRISTRGVLVEEELD